MLFLPALLGACLEPFPTGRHDLVDLRIVGMRADATGELGAYTWEGAEAWSATAPTREWGGDVVCADGCRLDGPGTATLTITGEDGATESGELAWGADAGALAWDRVSVDVDDDTASIVLDVPGAERVRWMAPAGELEESAPDTATYVLPGEGVWPVVGLWLDGNGGNGWVTVDVVSGVSGPFLRVGARRFPVDTDLDAGTGTFLGVVVAADTLAGFTFAELRPDDGTPLAPVCGDGDDRWDPDAVAERRCGLDEVLGHPVRVVGEVLR